MLSLRVKSKYITTCKQIMFCLLTALSCVITQCHLNVMLWSLRSYDFLSSYRATTTYKRVLSWVLIRVTCMTIGAFIYKLTLSMSMPILSLDLTRVILCTINYCASLSLILLPYPYNNIFSNLAFFIFFSTMPNTVANAIDMILGIILAGIIYMIVENWIIEEDIFIKLKNQNQYVYQLALEIICMNENDWHMLTDKSNNLLRILRSAKSSLFYKRDVIGEELYFATNKLHNYIEAVGMLGISMQIISTVQDPRYQHRLLNFYKTRSSIYQDLITNQFNIINQNLTNCLNL